MKIDTDSLTYSSMPQFLDQAQQLTGQLKKLDYCQAKKLWNCNDTIAAYHYKHLQSIDLTRNLTPAILAYQGIQYQYMAPSIFEIEQLDYLQTHLRIISGFYGLLRPFDGVVPYRLEMQAKLHSGCYRSLYQFWHDKLARQLCLETNVIVNLASKEYSKCITPFLPETVRLLTCTFGQLIAGKVIEKGTHCKMARGEMVRFMAENQIITLDQLQNFNRLGYHYSQKYSDQNCFCFIKQAD